MWWLGVVVECRGWVWLLGVVVRCGGWMWISEVGVVWVWRLDMMW